MAATGKSFTARMSGRCWVVRRPTNESQASDAHAWHVLLQARQTQGQRHRYRAQHPLTGSMTSWASRPSRNR